MKKIAIIGAGISGLYLANIFKQNSDFKVLLFEKNAEINLDDGYGIQLSNNSVKLLNYIGFDQLDDIAKTLLDEYTSKASTSSKNTASAGNTDGNTTIKPTTTQSTQSTQDTQGTKDTQDTQGSASTQADKMQKDVDKEVAGSIKKLQKDPEFAKIIKFADIVAKNKK